MKKRYFYIYKKVEEKMIPVDSMTEEQQIDFINKALSAGFTINEIEREG